MRDRDPNVKSDRIWAGYVEVLVDKDQARAREHVDRAPKDCNESVPTCAGACSPPYLKTSRDQRNTLSHTDTPTRTHTRTHTHTNTDTRNHTHEENAYFYYAHSIFSLPVDLESMENAHAQAQIRTRLRTLLFDTRTRTQTPTNAHTQFLRPNT